MERAECDEFAYHCHHCRRHHTHYKGYIFIVRLGGQEFYFCNIDCCNAWEMEQCKEVVPRDPKWENIEKVDRRGAVHATRKKNAGSHLEFFDKHKRCNPKFWQRCYANECWGVKRHNILKARDQ